MSTCCQQNTDTPTHDRDEEATCCETASGSTATTCCSTA